ncbi:MAG: hypothetical protein HN742_29490 [Lentisphaerae bacterium]|nr:hypothetical protein [Lentisphaerota bacterium]MBT4814689.1 hypothetical protein [Lentisphaerota bacterium]MBT5609031.1 hypothetical protein [Lentisphaerota bacterium]MBT7055463.1 hypothetical protein [Lentisphaerota bacterium]MBT7846042.1 hypothetical protein [Lentisphaerota bacterium]
MAAEEDVTMRSIGRILVLCLVVGLGAAVLVWRDRSAGRSTARLREISAFSDFPVGREFRRGQRARLTHEPGTDVSAYPTFRSAKPLYGSVSFGGELAKPGSGHEYCFAVDESKGTGEGYDRLHFDLNRDLDLSNDQPVLAWDSPPERAKEAREKWGGVESHVCFRYVDVSLGPEGDGGRTVEIMPQLLGFEKAHLALFLATKLRRGKVRIAGQRYDVLLGHPYSVSDRFDLPSTSMFLIPKKAPRSRARWWGADTLGALHTIGGKLRRFSVTPDGDRLSVNEYDGELGTFEVGTGGREISDVWMTGSLQTETAAVAVGKPFEKGRLEHVTSCRLPVGDYLPNYLTFGFGRLVISVSMNYHSDGKKRDLDGRVRVFGIEIREEAPFVFDFSNEPDVLFASPAVGARVKRGDELKVAAVLIDPKLDIMIRDLVDTGPVAETEDTLFGFGDKGNERKLKASLDPKVTITRAGGEVLAEGVMPFG